MVTVNNHDNTNLEDLLKDLEHQVHKAAMKVMFLENCCAERTKRSLSQMKVESGSNAYKRRRRATNFDEVARRYFTKNEQMAMTSVIGGNGDPKNGFCSNGCCSKGGERQKLGQRNMVIRHSDTGKITLGKWCYKCIAKSGIRTKRIAPDEDGRGGGGYMCTKDGCQEEGVGGEVDAIGCVVEGSLTCGCTW